MNFLRFLAFFYVHLRALHQKLHQIPPIFTPKSKISLTKARFSRAFSYNKWRKLLYFQENLLQQMKKYADYIHIFSTPICKKAIQLSFYKLILYGYFYWWFSRLFLIINYTCTKMFKLCLSLSFLASRKPHKSLCHKASQV